MNVVIVGAGSIGLLIGSYVAEMDGAVTFVTRREQQAKELREHGIVRDLAGQRLTFSVEATSDIGETPKEAIWILAVKSGELEEVLRQMESSVTPRYVLFIQNGLRHLEFAEVSSFHSIGFASITHGARRDNEYTVRHLGIGAMSIAHSRGKREGFVTLTSVDVEHFPVRVEQHAEQMLLRKVLMNCCINPLTAILEITNGELLTNKAAHEIMSCVYNELAEVYPETVRELSFADIEMICARTAENRSSMLTDREHAVRMEIDTIVTATIEGHRDRMPTLVLLETLLKAIEERKVRT